MKIKVILEAMKLFRNFFFFCFIGFSVVSLLSCSLQVIKQSLNVTSVDLQQSSEEEESPTQKVKTDFEFQVPGTMHSFSSLHSDRVNFPHYLNLEPQSGPTISIKPPNS